MDDTLRRSDGTGGIHSLADCDSLTPVMPVLMRFASSDRMQPALNDHAPPVERPSRAIRDAGPLTPGRAHAHDRAVSATLTAPVAPGALRRGPALAWPLAAVAVLLGAVGVGLHLWPGRLDGGDYGSWWITNASAAVAVGAIGGIVAARRPRNPVGWLLLADALAHGVTAAGREYALHALAHGSDLPGGIWAMWTSTWTYLDFPLLVPAVLLFPEGRLRSRRWAPVLAGGLALGAAAVVEAMTSPGPMIDPRVAPAINPLGSAAISGPIDGLGTSVLLGLVAAMAAGVGSMLLNARDATGPARRRIVLVAVASSILTAELLHEDLGFYAGQEYAGAAVTVLFSAAVAVAILRYGLYETDVVVSRTLVYGGLTVTLGGIYLGLSALTDVVVDGRVLGSLPGAIAVALLFAPAREHLQRASDRVLFGERDDPYAVIASLGEQLDAGGRAEVLPALADTVARTLKLPYVAIALERETGLVPAAERGRLRGEPLVLALVYGGTPVGHLTLGPRTPTDPFTAAERHLFADVARQVAVAAHAVRLTEDLQHSREQLVVAREEERRRLRRDLHDGLGPTLAGVALQLGSARLLNGRDVAAVDSLLAQLVEETQTAIGDVRRLVYDLRPPALDELGLVLALRQQADRFAGLRVVVEAAEPVLRLPAAVEVAAYRIATEALTNVSRHAEATRCTIAIALNGALEVEVRDDGRGMRDGWRPGVGVMSIRERAAELGGTCAVGNADGGGTRVLARLPLPESA